MSQKLPPEIQEALELFAEHCYEVGYLHADDEPSTSAESDRSASRASLTALLESRIIDSERLERIAQKLHGSKWSDVLPDFRPIDNTGDYSERYVDAKTFRQAIDAAALSGESSQ